MATEPRPRLFLQVPLGQEHRRASEVFSHQERAGLWANAARMRSNQSGLLEVTQNHAALGVWRGLHQRIFDEIPRRGPNPPPSNVQVTTGGSVCPGRTRVFMMGSAASQYRQGAAHHGFQTIVEGIPEARANPRHDDSRSKKKSRELLSRKCHKLANIRTGARTQVDGKHPIYSQLLSQSVREAEDRSQQKMRELMASGAKRERTV